MHLSERVACEMKRVAQAVSSRVGDVRLAHRAGLLSVLSGLAGMLVNPVLVTALIPVEGDTAIALWYVVLLFGMAAILGGVFALHSRGHVIALIGSTLAVPSFFITGIPALILMLLSRNEFAKDHTAWSSGKITITALGIVMTVVGWTLSFLYEPPGLFFLMGVGGVGLVLFELLASLSRDGQRVTK
jgi:hypothetical protein